MLLCLGGPVFLFFSSRMWSCGSEDNRSIFQRPWGNWIAWWCLSVEEDFWWRLYVDTCNIFRLHLRLVPYDSVYCTIIQFPIWRSASFVSSVILRNHEEWEVKKKFSIFCFWVLVLVLLQPQIFSPCIMKLRKRGGDAWENGMGAQRSLENFSDRNLYFLRFKGLVRKVQQQLTR